MAINWTLEHISTGAICQTWLNDAIDKIPQFEKLNDVTLHFEYILKNLPQIIIDTKDVNTIEAIEFIKEIHDVIPGCQVFPTIHCRIDPESLWVAATPQTSQLKPFHFFQPITSNNNTHLHSKKRAPQPYGRCVELCHVFFSGFKDR